MVHKEGRGKIDALFKEYSPEQAALRPSHVRDVLSEKHLVFLISAMVEKQDLSC